MSHRIVVIDDDAEVLALLGKVLVRAGHEVLSASTGEAGLSLIAEHEVHCVVVDKLLPHMGGLEVVAEVRRRWAHIPVVLVTAHPEPFNLGAERPEVVLAKPFKSLGAVEDAVREAIESKPALRGPLTNLKEAVAAVVAEMTPGRRRRE